MGEEKKTDTEDHGSVTNSTHQSNYKGARRNKKPRHRNNNVQNGPKGPSFKGNIADLHGQVFEVHSDANKATQYNDTVEHIIAYVTRTFSYG